MLKFKFKPIVNIYTGETYAIEVLNNYKDRIFNKVDKKGVFFKLSLQLLKKKLKLFKNSKELKNLKFFLTLDYRFLKSKNFNMKDILNILNSFDINLNNIYLNVSSTNYQNIDIYNYILMFKHYGIKVGIDNFGNGASDFKFLYEVEPDFIRVDEFFINQINKDFKKKLILSNLINILHTLGVKVIAPNIQTKQEFFLIKDLNVDLIEGNLISGELNSVSKIEKLYMAIKNLNRKDLRKKEKLSDKKLIKDRIKKITPLCIESPIVEIFNSFKKNRDRTFLPIIDISYEPIGMIRERDLKEYVYSYYGKDLLLNKSIGKSLMDFTSKCSIVDINTSLEKILEIFSNDYSSEGIIITKESKYLGFLSAKSLIEILNEKNLNIARNQNPLTKLAGNNSIHDYIENIFEDREDVFLIYFDFDNFKPYNDKYGFRQGDRMILLFSELMEKELNIYKSFLGHIGGDDFFVGLKGVDYEEGLNIIKDILEKFQNSARNFYSDEDKKNNFVILKDREGNIKTFPLLTASAVIVYIKEDSLKCSIEEISDVIAKHKKVSKYSPTKFAITSIRK